MAKTATAAVIVTLPLDVGADMAIHHVDGKHNIINQSLEQNVPKSFYFLNSTL